MDEETSGVIPAFETLGDGWYLFDVQAHKCHPDESVFENGQLSAMYIPLEM